MRMTPSLRALLGLTALGATLAACSDVSSPTALQPKDEPSLSSLTNVTLLDCPASEDSVAAATIGTTGGSLKLNGHRMDVPKGAVKGPKDFVATVRASRYLEVDFSAAGHQSFTFEKPVQLTIDYSRCTNSNLNLETEELRIYNIDPDTKAILEDMGGVDDKASRKVTAPTGHLTDYALGSPQ